GWTAGWAGWTSPPGNGSRRAEGHVEDRAGSVWHARSGETGGLRNVGRLGGGPDRHAHQQQLEDGERTDWEHVRGAPVGGKAGPARVVRVADRRADAGRVGGPVHGGGRRVAADRGRRGERREDHPDARGPAAARPR